MKTVGQFEIHDLFEIKSRGMVLSGKLLSEGEADVELNPGDRVHVRVNDQDRSYQIKSIKVGFGRIHGNTYFPSQNLALLLEIAEESEMEELRNWQPDKTIALLIAAA